MTDTTDWDNDVSTKTPEDDSFIELTEIVEDEANPDEEDVIELTEVVEAEPETSAQDALDEEVQVPFDTQAEDDFTDLDLDIEADDIPEAFSETQAQDEADDEFDDALENENDFLTGLSDEPVLENASRIPDDEVGEGSELGLMSTDPVAVDIQAEQGEQPSQLAVTSEQVEAALEKIIEKKFADKIEAVLFEVMEKVMEKELAAIKDSLQKDLDEIENT